MELFDDLPPPPEAAPTQIAPGAVLLHGFAREADAALLQAVESVLTQPSGYRYAAFDPLSGQPWPAMPVCLLELAQRAAARAGYAKFQPDACLINEYVPGAKLSLHQDKDEKDLYAPIVSLSLGLPAVFLFGTPSRKDRPQRWRLVHGDVVVWGGPSRLAYHGVSALADGEHALRGRRRLNLTFRCAG
jgi:alkylated DNA repair protein (DNA oxidative demethylase)